MCGSFLDNHFKSKFVMIWGIALFDVILGVLAVDSDVTLVAKENFVDSVILIHTGEGPRI